MTPAARLSGAASRARFARARARTTRGAFTLVELSVALMAGLVVALGIVGLSREATRTFNEESRSSAAEAAMRTAIDRLRADLARASYMSTGNILSDTNIAHKMGMSNLSNLTNSNMTGMKQLAALHLLNQGSFSANGLALSSLQTPTIAPDAMVIGGNMTTAEQFDVQSICWLNKSAMPPGCQPPTGTCTQILLSSTSPAIYRAIPAGLTSPLASAELNNIFAPVSGNGTTAQFMVRLLDDTGHTQYLATCAQSNVAGVTTGQPYVWVDTADTAILQASDTQGAGGVGGRASGKAWINPVQLVRWEILSTAQEQLNNQQFSNALGNVTTFGNVDPNKYDLVRSYVDVFGKTITPSTEVIAEYAVDLKFAFTVDESLVGATAPNVVSFAFEDGNSPTWAPDISTESAPPASPPVNVGAQRIRSVRVRLAVRTALPDRTVNVGVPNQFGNEAYMYRYCINAPCNTSDGTPRWARVRTATTEVALPNNSGWYY